MNINKITSLFIEKFGNNFNYFPKKALDLSLNKYLDLKSLKDKVTNLITAFGYKVIKVLPQDRILIVFLNINFMDNTELKFHHRTSNKTTPQCKASAQRAYIENRNLLKEKFLLELDSNYAPLNKKDKIKSIYLFYRESSEEEITEMKSFLRAHKSGAAQVPPQAPKPLLISPPKVPTLHPNQWLDYFYKKPFVELTFSVLSDLVDAF
jgi:hypothetical protein